MIVHKTKRPRGYFCLNLVFKTPKSAESFIRKEALLKKSEKLEHPELRIKKNYILTKIGSKFLLWKKLK